MNMGGACSSWAAGRLKLCSAQPRRLSVRSVRGRPPQSLSQNGGEKKGGRGRQRSAVVGKIRRPTSAKGRRLKAMHAVSCIDVGPLTLLFELVDSAASCKRSRSLLRIFLSKLRKHDLEENRISLSNVGRNKNKVFSLRLSTESNTDMKVEQRASPQREHEFSRVCTTACIVSAPKNSFLWWLRATDDCSETF